uniref:No apical meristem-associated C-terminal domain-containing protein n=1 Tax=Brassica oleracea var. oleracea TaxID=109376 RepID=A0A0D3DIJ9_BRAOL
MKRVHARCQPSIGDGFRSERQFLVRRRAFSNFLLRIDDGVSHPRAQAHVKRLTLLLDNLTSDVYNLTVQVADLEKVSSNEIQKLVAVLSALMNALCLLLVQVKTIEVGSSDVPKPVERRKWTTQADIVLISAWLNTSKDPIVCKFVGSYEAALKEQSSGQNENDVMKSAHDIFLNDYQVKFTLEHAWRELRFDQKWRSNSVSKDGAKEKKKEPVETVPDSEEVRPPGVKACKAAKHKKHGNEAAFDRLESILDLKQNISKQKLLERLLSKKDTLTDSEVSLKDKLVSEML